MMVKTEVKTQHTSPFMLVLYTVSIYSVSESLLCNPQSLHLFVFIFFAQQQQQQAYALFYTHPRNPHGARKHPPTCTDTHIREASLLAHTLLAFGRFSIFGLCPSQEPSLLSSPPYLIYLRKTSGV